MKALKHISLITALFLIGASAISQHVLKGRVLDDEGKPIEKCMITSQQDPLEYVHTDSLGMFVAKWHTPCVMVQVAKAGFQSQVIAVDSRTFVEVVLASASKPEVVIESPDLKVVQAEYDVQSIVQMDQLEEVRSVSIAKVRGARHQRNYASGMPSTGYHELPVRSNESYASISENGFKRAADEPLSTFSIDVDRASYSNVRRFLNNGSLPPADAVRIEEMINYFEYSYPKPKAGDPVAVYTEMTKAPWNTNHRLLQVGVQAKTMDKSKLPPSNLVFLIDVSGSMSSANKLPLLQSSMKMLVSELREEDHVAIVVYAGAAGLVLESTPGNEKKKINDAIDRLKAGGSTAGGAGINLAYSVAAQNYKKEGTNRVILATDGDFNVGASSDASMEQLITQKRTEGVFLTALGFGMGNYKDSKLEVLADKGNGNYAYIDNITEARKTLVEEFAGTLFAVAKDVKIQIEFNPANVAEYRLIGYENRLLNKEDFNDDRKDAGEMGVDHTVTALYEIVPIGVMASSGVDPLKYAPKEVREEQSAPFSDELATVKLRYKLPEASTSNLMSSVVAEKDVSELPSASNNLRWAASVASFGMLLRSSEHSGKSSYEGTIALANTALGDDKKGYRAECVQMMRIAEQLTKQTAGM